MIRSLKELFGNQLLATDGSLGKIHDFMFDDHSWTIRYMVADTGGWLTGRLVLISPVALGEADWEARTFPVNLTRRQIEESPGIEANLPVSRQQEAELTRHYGWPTYWGGGGLFSAGVGMAPELVVPQKTPTGEQPSRQETHFDPHLRSVREVDGYRVRANDGEIGHVEDLLTNDEEWTVRYLVIDTRNWIPGKRVLLAPEWVDSVSWGDARVYVDLGRDLIQNAPAYRPGMAVNRRFEERLHAHYGRPGYWAQPEPARR